MSKLILVIVAILIKVGFVMGQPDWNWPEEGTELWDNSQEQQAYYKVNFQLEEWEKSLNALNWLYQNNPDLHPSIYKDGVKIIEEIMAMDIAQERYDRLADSLLWTYDQRLRYFDEGGEVMDRKAYSAFKLYYKMSEKYAMIDQLFEQAYKNNGVNMSTFILTPYMSLAKFYHQVNPNEMPSEKVLEIHSRISETIEAKKQAGTDDPDLLKKEQDKVDAMLSSIGNILSCEFIETKLVPRFKAQPSDLNTAKKIFTYSLKAKCSGKSYFVKAGEVVYKNDPSYALAIALGTRYMSLQMAERSLDFFIKASEMASGKEEQYEALINQALAYSKLGQKISSREKARAAAAVKPGDPRSYNVIGNLYFSSFEECRNGESKVKDRAVFIAAYYMYEKAGNKDQMNRTKEQFPSIEEIFNEGYEVGNKVIVGCWIGETVSIDRRN